jgi:hypothetical protein
MEDVSLRLTWDTEADAGYFALTAIGPGEAISQRIVENPVDGIGDIVLDFDAQGDFSASNLGRTRTAPRAYCVIVGRSEIRAAARRGRFRGNVVKPCPLTAFPRERGQGP